METAGERSFFDFPGEEKIILVSSRIISFWVTGHFHSARLCKQVEFSSMRAFLRYLWERRFLGIFLFINNYQKAFLIVESLVHNLFAYEAM